MGRATPTPRPSKVLSLRYSSRTRFRTGECSAAQSIFLCPSGARPGSLTIDCMLLLLLGLGPFSSGGYRFLDSLHLLAPAEHEAADDDEQQKRNNRESYA